MTAKQLIKAMKDLNLSVDRNGDDELAERLGVCRVTVYRWRTGRGPIPKMAASALTRLLDSEDTKKPARRRR